MWTLTDEKQNEIVDEIDCLEDRGAALVAEAFLEDRHKDLLFATMRDDPDIKGKLFKGAGPFASFSARIDFGYLLRLYDNETRETLHLIRLIRNNFAHEIWPITFETQSIRDRCNQLPNVDNGLFPEVPLPEGEDAITEALADFAAARIFNVEDTPRNRYMAIIQLYLIAFALRAFGIKHRLSENPILPKRSVEISGQ